MIPVLVTSAAAVTGLGDSLDETWRRLLQGESAIAPVTRFDTSAYQSRLASCVPGLSRGGQETLLAPLLERLFAGFPDLPAESRLLLATTKGGIDVLERQRRGEDVLLAPLLPETTLAAVAGRFGLKDGGVNINAACASSTIAVARGAALIASGFAETVLVCCLDLVSEFVFSGFSALRALSPEPSRPFDRERAGLTLGEGAAALVLMSPEAARRCGRLPLGRVLGWGVANDATHITAPARDGCGLILAVRQALAKAELCANAVSAISAHGTGTVYNDLMELTAFATVFGAHRVPIHSVKGAIGHTLGAAGGIEVALGFKALSAAIVPPTAGFRTPEAGAEDIVSSQAVSFAGDVLLTTNSGFGGVNAALLLGKGEAA